MRINEPIAWMRKHPDGPWADDLLPNWQIEQVHKDSGAWVPLYAWVPTCLLAERDQLAVDLARADEENDRLREANRARLLEGALVSKNWAESRELQAVQEADELRASLKEVLNHWREFGPDHGFDECIERAAGRRGLDG